MASSQVENSDYPEFDDGSIDDLLDNLSDLDSSQDISETESDSDSSTSTSNTLEDTSSDNLIAQFEKLAESQRQANRSPAPPNNLDRNFLAEYEAAIAIETESASTQELVNAVNTLIPLIVELLEYEIEDSQESILQKITPVLERIIEQRTKEEPQKMATAIAKILPSAITENINLSPQKIAKAIAPELALSIEEQIRLDKNAISKALGSEMGKAIKTQIEVEKDAMVDALYPVIGDTISKYMIEVVQEINRRVENTLSIEGFQRKLRARLKGVSEAELIFQESIGCHLQAIFLIDKDSGLIVQEVQQSGEQELDSEMVAGMLTAIRSFANDCIVSGSELDSIDYGNWQIHLEVAGYCYLAIVLKGEPTKNFLARIRHTFGNIVLNYGSAIQNFEGNIDTIPDSIKSELESLIELENELEKKVTPPTTLLWLLTFIATILVILWGTSNYRSRAARNIERLAAVRLDAAPELSVYRLEPTVNKGKLTVQGRVPSAYLRDRAAGISQNIAKQNNLEFDNQIATVDVPVNPTLLTGEISRLTELFNREPEVYIKTKYLDSSLFIEGFVLDENIQESIIRAFNRIPGVKKTIINIDNKLPELEAKVDFKSAFNKVDLVNNSRQIESTIAFLERYPQLNLKLLAYTDGIGSKQINLQLNRQRCANLKDVLIAKGVKSSRLTSDCNTYRISNRQTDRTVRLTRYIKFEPYIPKIEFP